MTHKITQNYDFGNNWDKVLPYVLKMNIEDILFDILEEWGRIYDNDADKLIESEPAKLCSSDAYFQLKLDLVNFVFSGIKGNSDDEEDDDDYDVRFLDSYFNWKTNKNHLSYYIPFGCCHEWNPKFCLPLAQKVLPDRNWKIRKGEKHTTVYSEETNEVFDILYWGIDGRDWDHLLSRYNKESATLYRSKDESLGGNLAIEMSIASPRGSASDCDCDTTKESK